MIQIAILGCGTVASGVCRLLARNRADISKRIQQEIQVRYILARTPQKARALGFSDEQICRSAEPILNDPAVQIVVELMGGTDTAFELIKAAMQRGKHIVTANKDLIAERGRELFEIAEQNGVDLYFEASVGGGIPIIHPLKVSLAANRFTEIIGILNGTTNFILTKMAAEGLSFGRALALAQELGYAEANPDSDLLGTDAARKIAILASIAFNSRVTLADVYCEGINEVDDTDIALARRMGYVVKLLAVARLVEGRVLMFVRPAFVPAGHPLASVNDSFNALFVRGDAVGDIMLYGRGAGAEPTASAVIGDIMEVCRGIRAGGLARLGCECYASREIAEIDELIASFFVRLRVSDQPNVLAGVARAFGEQGVSLSSLMQTPDADGTAELNLITHPAPERAIRAALDALMQRDYVSRIHLFICLDGTGEG